MIYESKPTFSATHLSHKDNPYKKHPKPEIFLSSYQNIITGLIPLSKAQTPCECE